MGGCVSDRCVCVLGVMDVCGSMGVFACVHLGEGMFMDVTVCVCVCVCVCVFMDVTLCVCVCVCSWM